MSHSLLLLTRPIRVAAWLRESQTPLNVCALSMLRPETHYADLLPRSVRSDADTGLKLAAYVHSEGTFIKPDYKLYDANNNLAEACVLVRPGASFEVGLVELRASAAMDEGVCGSEVLLSLDGVQ